MAQITNFADHTAAQRAMIDGLKSHLRSAIREQFEPIAKKAVEDAIEDAMSAFEASIHQYVDRHSLQYTMKVLLEDARSGGAK